MGSEGEVRIVALGNQDRGDDGAALLVARRFEAEASVVLAGRPGVGLIEFLPPDQHCILLDVTVSGVPPGTVQQWTLEELKAGFLPDARVSTHGFGPGEALALARTLNRRLPRGYFVGIEGESFGEGQGLSPAVSKAISHFEERVRTALHVLANGGGFPHQPR